MRTRLSLVALAVACLLLPSCLDYEEDMVIRKDLSGKVTVTLTLPDTLLPKYESVGAAFDEARLRPRFDAAEGVKLVSYSKSADRRPVVKLQIEFSSLDALNAALAHNTPASLLGGRFIVTKVDGKTRIERKVGEGEPLNDLPENNHVIYKTHFEEAVVSTNSRTFDRAHNNVRYQYKLLALLAHPDLQVTEVSRTLGWKWLAITLSILAVGLYYGWMVFGRKKKILINSTPLHSVEERPVGRAGADSSDPAQPGPPGSPPQG